MISTHQRERAEELSAHGEPFVTATVVRVQRPTSAKAGDVALVCRNGTIDGFVGGVCAQHSVRLYSLKVMESGDPLLLRIMPDPDAAGEEESERGLPESGGAAGAGEVLAEEEGSVTVQNPCLSGGAIEVFLEPHVPSPRVVLVGESPIVGALCQQGPSVDLKMVIGGGRDGEVPGPVRGDLALIVCAHGRDEVAALHAGLEAEIPYIGLVASPKRGQAVLEELAHAGVAPALIQKIDTPAGLFIHARTPAEVALSILARIIEVRRSQDTVLPVIHQDDEPAQAPRVVVDPICGMTVVVIDDTPAFERDGETTYFCCEGCRDRFARQSAA